MICLDMDGTLLNSQDIISENSKTILKQLKKLGKIIVIITGRSIKNSEKHLSEEFVDYILANNGSVWYSLKDKKIIKKNIINYNELINIITDYKSNILYLTVKNYQPINFDKTEEAIKYLNKYDDVTSCELFMKDNNYTELVDTMKTKYKDLEFQIMQFSFNEQKWIDILPKDNNKGSNLKKLAEYLNIDIKNIIAFGDGLNDIIMLKTAGISVAMKNALPEVKQVAKYITDSNDNDGIYKFLNHYFFE